MEVDKGVLSIWMRSMAVSKRSSGEGLGFKGKRHWEEGMWKGVAVGVGFRRSRARSRSRCSLKKGVVKGLKREVSRQKKAEKEGSKRSNLWKPFISLKRGFC